VRIFVQPNDFGSRLDVVVYNMAEVPGDLTRVLRCDNGNYRWDLIAQDVRLDGPSLSLPMEIAQDLTVSLLNYFDGGVGDTRALRKDYDAERKRVDTFIGALLARESS
jgi:hypothetical protein